MPSVNKDANQKPIVSGIPLEGQWLYQILRRSPDRFVLVGNGGGDLYRGKGSLIDSAEVIFRFNNYNLDHPKDYGERFDGSRDVWVHNGFGDVAGRPAWEGAIICPRPLEAERYYLQHRRARFANFGIRRDQVEIIPPNIWDRFINRVILHRVQTTGLEFWASNKGLEIPYHSLGDMSSGAAVAWWIVHLTARRLKRDQVVGFSFFDDGFAHHYGDDVDHTICDGSFERHFFDQEIF